MEGRALMILRQLLLGTAAISFMSGMWCSAPACARAQAEDASLQYMTGAEPIDDAEYDALPKTARFRAFLPKKVDLSPLFPKPGNQGQQPSCVAWATSYAAQTFLVAESTADRMRPAKPMSPAYVYNRLRKPGSACDRPVRIVDALRLLQNEGTVTLAEFPDDIARCQIAAPQALLGKAKENRLTRWQAIARTRADGSSRVVLDDVKGALSRDEPVVFAMPAMPDFKALKGDAIYQHKTPEKTNWHAMAAIGYDETRQAFRIINSWGNYWADEGYAWIDYQTFALLVGEAYTMKMEPPSTKPMVKNEFSGPISAKIAFKEKLAAITCGKITYSEQGSRLKVTGFAGNETELADLRALAAKADGRLKWNVEHHPWPQCEAELTLDSTSNGGGDATLSILSEDGVIKQGSQIAMQGGEVFGLSAQTATAKPWLTLIYLQADGSAITLFNAETDGKPVRLGLSGERANRFQVAPPFGNEMVIALSSDAPLFEPNKSQFETDRQFLTGLRSKLLLNTETRPSFAVIRLISSP
jgi:hypothetical protein